MTGQRGRFSFDHSTSRYGAGKFPPSLKGFRLRTSYAGQDGGQARPGRGKQDDKETRPRKTTAVVFRGLTCLDSDPNDGSSTYSAPNLL